MARNWAGSVMARNWAGSVMARNWAGSVMAAVVDAGLTRSGLFATVVGVSADEPAQGRWQRLFGDLDAEAEAAERAALVVEVMDRARAEFGRVRLVDRLRGSSGHPVRCQVLGGEAVAGLVRDVGPDWVLLGEPSGAEALVPLARIAAVTGLGLHSAPPGSEGRVGARLDLRYVLRRLARERAGLTVVLADGTGLAGTLDRVGADFVEVAEHPAGEPRRGRDVRQVRTVPLAALAVLRSAR
jgi:hypothetical protein